MYVNKITGQTSAYGEENAQFVNNAPDVNKDDSRYWQNKPRSHENKYLGHTHIKTPRMGELRAGALFTWDEVGRLIDYLDKRADKLAPLDPTGMAFSRKISTVNMALSEHLLLLRSDLKTNLAKEHPVDLKHILSYCKGAQIEDLRQTCLTQHETQASNNALHNLYRTSEYKEKYGPKWETIQSSKEWKQFSTQFPDFEFRSVTSYSRQEWREIIKVPGLENLIIAMSILTCNEMEKQRAQDKQLAKVVTKRLYFELDNAIAAAIGADVQKSLIAR